MRRSSGCPRDRRGRRRLLIVDVARYFKTRSVLNALINEHLVDPGEEIALLVATHHHGDHIGGMANLMSSHGPPHRRILGTGCNAAKGSTCQSHDCRRTRRGQPPSAHGWNDEILRRGPASGIGAQCAASPRVRRLRHRRERHLDRASPRLPVLRGAVRPDGAADSCRPVTKGWCSAPTHRRTRGPTYC
jgi:hypothetical protein